MMYVKIYYLKNYLINNGYQLSRKVDQPINRRPLTKKMKTIENKSFEIS